MAFNHSWQAVFNPGESDDYFMGDQTPRFTVEAVGFNPINAWWLSELSRLIYRMDMTEGVNVPERASRNDFLARVGLIERHFFNGPYIQAALVETITESGGAFAVLVFRGTRGRLSNWLLNLDLTTSAWPPGGMVHRGFKSVFMSRWAAIAAVLEKVDKPCFYTGHSLGGAMATLAASLLSPRAVYTFGAPRIGDAAFARTLARIDVFNVRNPHDIVTELPPTRWWSDFAHVGTVVNNMEHNPTRRTFSKVPSFLADHAPINYTAQLPFVHKN
jgi:predicted lipase